MKENEIKFSRMSFSWNCRQALTDFISGSEATYHIKNIPERYIETSLRETELTMKRIENVLKRSKSI